MNKNVKIFLAVLIGVIIVGSIGLLVIARYKNVPGDERGDVAGSGMNEVSENVDDGESGTDTASLDAASVSADVPEAADEEEPEEIEEVLDEFTFRLEPAEDGTVTFAFAGDILFDPGYAIFSSYRQKGEQIENCISESLLNEMRSADIMMVNNEFPYSDRGTPQEDKMYTFCARTESVSVLYDMGVDIVSIANNHSFDYGETAFLDTLDTLEQAGMPYVGGGHNIDEAVQPIYYLLGDMKIAVLGATQIERNSNPNTRGATEELAGVFRCLDPTRLEEEIRKAKEECDFVILYIHWGTESTDVLDWGQTGQASKYVEAGADIIIGDHPHCLQEIGYIDGVPIIYSLGNFWFNSRTMDSCLVKMTLSEEGIQTLQFLPCLQSGCKVSLLTGAEHDRVIRYMQRLSLSANIDDDGFVTDPEADGFKLPVPPAPPAPEPEPEPASEQQSGQNPGTTPENAPQPE